jgi:hypothetical protein
VQRLGEKVLNLRFSTLSDDALKRMLRGLQAEALALAQTKEAEEGTGTRET